MKKRIKQVKHAAENDMSFATLCKIHPFFKRYAHDATDVCWYNKLLQTLYSELEVERDLILRAAPHFYSSTGDIKECVELARMLVNEVYHAEGED